MTFSKKPEFFIVGAPKCGTTALWYWLRQHPKIFMPEKKELHYFGQDLDMFHPTLEEYLYWFQDVREDQIAGEASASYIYSQTAPYEILEFSPKAKVIIALRNPVDMVYSLHAQLVFNGEEPLKGFREALLQEPKRKKGYWFSRYKKAPTIYFLYTEAGKLSEYVKRYVNIFKDRVCIILYDDLKQPQKVYDRILEFLGVDSEFKPSFSVMNPYKRPRSYLLSKVIAAAPSTLVGKLLRKTVSPKMRHIIATKLLYWNSHYADKPPLELDLRKQLAECFQDDIVQLSKIINRDLSTWLE